MSDQGPGSERETFRWDETEERLAALLDRVDLEPDGSKRAFVGERADGRRVVFTPPLVLGIASATQSAHEYLAELPAGLGCECIVLLQAGATALGLWRDDELLRHKAAKKYVVRGHGRAQPTHLEAKGKSRYGSRLRLQNARALLEEINARLVEWAREDGPFDRVYYSCPVRLWADLRRAKSAPPFDTPPIKIPLDVQTPTFQELTRVRRWLVRGTVEQGF